MKLIRRLPVPLLAVALIAMLMGCKGPSRDAPEPTALILAAASPTASFAPIRPTPTPKPPATPSPRSNPTSSPHPPTVTESPITTPSLTVLPQPTPTAIVPDVNASAQSAPTYRPTQTSEAPLRLKLPLLIDSEAGRIIYLSYVSFSCIPYVGYSVIAYDVSAGAEIGRWGGSTFEATVFDGRLYADDWYRMGSGTLSTLLEGKPWTTSTNWSSGAQPLLIDSTRRRLFWDTSQSLRVFDADTMRLLMIIPRPHPGILGGYDPATDQLYFLSNESLQTYPAGEVAPQQPAPPPAAALPRQPVTHLAVSSGWPQDRTLTGIWGYTATSDDCYVWGGRGGTIYLSSDGGTSWRASSTGLPSGCEIASALALSSGYTRDRTLLAALEGAGIFKSIDGGASWAPASWELPSMQAYWLELSPGFARDGTAFASVVTGSLQRTTDGGASWH